MCIPPLAFSVARRCALDIHSVRTSFSQLRPLVRVQQPRTLEVMQPLGASSAIPRRERHTTGSAALRQALLSRAKTERWMWDGAPA